MTEKKINFLKNLAKEHNIIVPEQKYISEKARNQVLDQFNYTKHEIKKNFSSLLSEIETKTYSLYCEYETKYGQKLLKLLVDKIRTKFNYSIEIIGEKLGEHFKHLDTFFLSLSQSRRSRAGKTFENSIKSLFKSLDYPFDDQQTIDGKPDFLIPSRNHYKTNAMDCIIFTAKRTLRERWRQIVTEGARGRGFYLATIDTEISTNQLIEMKNHKIYVVCPKATKEENYKETVNVITFEQFFEDHLDPAMNRWGKNGIV